jgi:hypothetical protein
MLKPDTGEISLNGFGVDDVVFIASLSQLMFQSDGEPFAVFGPTHMDIVKHHSSNKVLLRLPEYWPNNMRINFLEMLRKSAMRETTEPCSVLIQCSALPPALQKNPVSGFWLFRGNRINMCKYEIDFTPESKRFLTSLDSTTSPSSVLERLVAVPSLDIMGPAAHPVNPAKTPVHDNPESVAFQEIQQRLNCVICFEAEKSVTLKPCFHLACCGKCAMEIQKTTNVCPVCRVPLDGYIVATRS